MADDGDDPVLRALYRRYHRHRRLRTVFAVLAIALLFAGAPCLLVFREPASTGMTVGLCLLFGCAFLVGLVILLEVDIARCERTIEAYFFASGQQPDKFAAMYFSASATEQRSGDGETDE